VVRSVPGAFSLRAAPRSRNCEEHGRARDTPPELPSQLHSNVLW
jgi:hypothetical protein